MKLRVTKRDGSLADFDVQKIKRMMSFACEGLSVDPLKLEALTEVDFFDGIKTSQIQQCFTQAANSLCSLEEPEWSLVAGRLEMMSIWSDVEHARGYKYNELSLYDHINRQVELGIYEPAYLQCYSQEELEEAGSLLTPSCDLVYDLAGARLWKTRYLLKHELPQEALLISALIIASQESEETRMRYVSDIYQYLKERKISLATPMLGNMRKPGGSTSSCFINSIDDSLLEDGGIMKVLTDIASISKNGGGVGTCMSKLRANGSWIKQTKGLAKGVIPWVKMINATAIAVDQLGKRQGAVTVALDVWHYDIEEFLQMRTENGDERRKARDVFPQVVVPNLFIEKAVRNDDWYLVCPYEVKTKLGTDITEVWGEDFDYFYENILVKAAVDGTLELVKKISAKELLTEIAKVSVETGLPYIWFKDNVNSVNPNKDSGFIPCGNLCVTPETLVLTDKGQLPIIDLVGSKVNVWNGKQWSEVTPFQTGNNKEVLKVTLSNGAVLECTPEHHFWVKPSYKDLEVRVSAKDLKPGNKLIKYDLPVIEGTEEFPYAYTHGLFCAEGTMPETNLPALSLYGEKKFLVPYINIRNKVRGGATHSYELEEVALYDDVKQDRIVCQLPKDINGKFEVPFGNYTIQSRLSWFSGLCDGDGTIARNGDNESIQIQSTNLDFLNKIRLMLQTLGVDSKVSNSLSEGFRYMPDGKGGLKEYWCNKAWRLLVNSSGLYKLGKLGFQTNRLKWSVVKPQRCASRFVTVKEVEYTGRISDTYCLTEPERNMCMFNGVLTGQCQESWSVVKPHTETHVCSLVSVNWANCLSSFELIKATKLAVRILDNSINITTAPVPSAETHNTKYRVIGIGDMGVADHLAYKELQYDSAEGLKYLDAMFEIVSLAAFRESVDIAKEKGAFPAFSKSEFAKGIILGKDANWFDHNACYPHSWKFLREDIELYGIRNSQLKAIAPNTSSSLLQGCSPTALPVFNKTYQSRGVTVMPPYIKEKFWFYKEYRRYAQDAIIDAVAVMQKWVDTGISFEFMYDLNEPRNTGKYIVSNIIKASREGIKAIYYTRSIVKDRGMNESKECEVCAN